MRNHFHLVVETPKANLVAGMRWLLSACTIRFNHRHKLSGHVFSGRYKALLVEGGGNGYLKTVCDYVHLNPVRAERIIAEELRRHGWTEADLVARHKGDLVKMAMAARLRRETTLTVGWIAARLKTGTRQSTTTRLQEFKRPRQTGK